MATVHPSNWHVITGAPCSGKTAVIQMLADQGHRTVAEVARSYIDDQLAQGKSLATIKADPMIFERHILMEKVGIERCLPKKETIFLDRAIPDSIAYYQLEGLDPAEPMQQSRFVRYKTIFLFEALPFEKDAVRTEDQVRAQRIEALLSKAYRGLGYSIVRVPVLSIARRMAFVLSHRHASGKC
jgi:predicted ATPase